MANMSDNIFTKKHVDKEIEEGGEEGDVTSSDEDDYI